MGWLSAEESAAVQAAGGGKPQSPSDAARAEESAQSGRPSVCRRVSSGAAAMLRLHVTNEGINKMGLSMP